MKNCLEGWAERDFRFGRARFGLVSRCVIRENNRRRKRTYNTAKALNRAQPWAAAPKYLHRTAREKGVNYNRRPSEIQRTALGKCLQAWPV